MQIQIQIPVAGELIQGFGGNAALYARFGLRGHNGLDYACPIGTPVFAAAPGTVTKIQTEPDGYGLHVRLTHAWGRSIYAHLSQVTCRLGQVVPAGALIARSGSSGFSDCPHLHFEVRQNGLEGNGFNGALDPLPLLTVPHPGPAEGPHPRPAEGPRPELVEGCGPPPTSTGSASGDPGSGHTEGPYPELVEGCGDLPHAVSPLYEKQPQRIQVVVAQLMLRYEPMRRAQKAGMLFQGLQADVLDTAQDEEGTRWYQVLRPAGWVAGRAEGRDLVAAL